jgi:hypothetical protein
MDFIAINNQSSSAGFEPTNLGFNDKHDNQQTTEDDRIFSNSDCIDSNDSDTWMMNWKDFKGFGRGLI